MQISKEENRLLKELADKYDYPPFDKYKHVTSRILADELGLTIRAAQYRLEALRAEGRLVREKVRMPDGYIIYGYFISD